MKKLINWCSRYLSIMAILVVAFIAYTMFFQENSIFKYMEYSKTIDSLEYQIKQCQDTLAYYHELNSRLTTDPEEMEKVVREHYNMVRDGEDVYVFETE